MAQRPGVPSTSPGDLEYELAHEGRDNGDDRAVRPDDETKLATYVATETPGYTGDYGYDLSHDIPKR